MADIKLNFINASNDANNSQVVIFQQNENSPSEIVSAWKIVPVETGKPTCIIANTIKGHGVSFMENKPEWHHGVPSDAQLAAAIEELMKGD